MCYKIIASIRFEMIGIVIIVIVFIVIIDIIALLIIHANKNSA